MRPIVLAVLGAAIGLWIARPASDIVLDDFEQNPATWKYVGGQEYPGAKGGVSVDSTVAHGGKRSYRLEADFSGGGAYVGIWRNLGVLQGRNFKELQIWFKTSTMTWVSIRLSDSTGQCHQKAFALEPTTDWQKFVLHPEEILADNFATLMEWRSDGVLPPANPDGFPTNDVDLLTAIENVLASGCKRTASSATTSASLTIGGGRQCGRDQR
jgi:hypothetical protein